MEVTFKIDKAEALKEVRRLTAYIGSRKQGDDGAYVRISATDSDAEMLEQFWKAACAAVTEQFKPFIKSVTNDTYYTVVLDLSNSYDENLNTSVEESLLNFAVSFIVSKWCKITSPDEYESYGADAVANIDDVVRKVYFKKKPTRKSTQNRKTI